MFPHLHRFAVQECQVKKRSQVQRHLINVIDVIVEDGFYVLNSW